MVCGHSIRFRSNMCGQIRAAELSEKMSIGGADPRRQSRVERIVITEIKIEKGAILSHKSEPQTLEQTLRDPKPMNLLTMNPVPVPTKPVWNLKDKNAPLKEDYVQFYQDTVMNRDFRGL
jgi:hypothetical protein